jgi:hypothetical protein
MADYFFKNIDNNYYKDISYNAILPNLRYKNNNIYFIPKNPIKIRLNGKIEYKYEFILEDMELTAKINCIDTELTCKILEKENENGLIVNIKFRDNSYICKQDMQKFARAVEAAILDIDLMDDNDSDISDTNYCNEYSYHANKIYDDDNTKDDYSNDEIIEENKEIDENEDNYDNYDNFKNI